MALALFPKMAEAYSYGTIIAEIDLDDPNCAALQFTRPTDNVFLLKAMLKAACEGNPPKADHFMWDDQTIDASRYRQWVVALLDHRGGFGPEAQKDRLASGLYPCYIGKNLTPVDEVDGFSPVRRGPRS